MKQKKRIEVKIKDGDVNFDAIGYEGKECVKDLESLSKLLEITEKVPKPEYYKKGKEKLKRTQERSV